MSEKEETEIQEEKYFTIHTLVKTYIPVKSLNL